MFFWGGIIVLIINYFTTIQLCVICLGMSQPAHVVRQICHRDVGFCPRHPHASEHQAHHALFHESEHVLHSASRRWLHPVVCLLNLCQGMPFVAFLTYYGHDPAFAQSLFRAHMPCILPRRFALLRAAFQQLEGYLGVVHIGRGDCVVPHDLGSSFLISSAGGSSSGLMPRCPNMSRTLWLFCMCSRVMGSSPCRFLFSTL